MNRKQNALARVLVFGEVLFDSFSDGREVLGGAPFNLAWNLKGMGFDPLLITRIGEDENGRSIRENMRRWGLDTSAVQLDSTHPTGRVEIQLSGTAHNFDILPDQAYDFISQEPLKQLLQDSSPRMIYRGTLAMRTENNARTWKELMRQVPAPAVFLDVNLREPWWNMKDLKEALSEATWVKINDEELELLVGSELETRLDYREVARDLISRHDLDMLFLTCGAHGSALFDKHGSVYWQGAGEDNIQIVDTVGAGDAYAAAVVAGLLRKSAPPEMISRAAEFAARICRIRGATCFESDLYQKWKS